MDSTKYSKIVQSKKNENRSQPPWVRSLVFIICAVIIPLALLLTIIHFRNNNHPIFKQLIATTDTIPLHESLSKVWCKGQKISTLKNTSFNVYVVDSDSLKIEKAKRKIKHFHHKLLLFRGDGVALHFYLLKHSMLEIKICSSLDGAFVNVVKGEEEFKRCSRQLTNSQEDGDSFEFEDFLGDGSSVSSSEQVVLLNPDMSMVCNRSIESRPLRQSPRCRKKKLSSDRITIRTNDTDGYYILFSSKNLLDIIPNELDMEITLHKTVYKIGKTTPRYFNVTSCEVNYQLGSTEHLLVEIPNIDQNLRVDLITSSCVPRRVIYLVLLIAILIMIMIAGFYF